MVIYRSNKGIALLFDDGPNPAVTPKILDVLSQKGVPANFFLIGMRAEQSPQLVKRIYEAGHEIGNHTYSHKRLAELFVADGEQAVIDEVTKGQQAIEQAANLNNNQIKYLRPPYLSWNNQLAKIIEPLYGDNVVASGLAIADYYWGIDDKWDENNKLAISKQARLITESWLQVTNDGTLLAFHDSSEHNLPGNKQLDSWMNRALPTLEALPAIVDGLHAKGFEFYKLSEMDLIKEPLHIN